MRTIIISAIDTLSEALQCIRLSLIGLSQRVRMLKLCRSQGVTLSKQQREAVRRYWRTYTRRNRSYFQSHYSFVHGKFDVRYIPNDLWVTVIDPYLNDRKFGVFGNKFYQRLLFDCPQPDTIFMRSPRGVYYNDRYETIPKERAVGLFMRHGRAVFKPLASAGGRGITFLESDKEEEIAEFLDSLENTSGYVAQEVVEQHPLLSSIHGDSLNTLRIMTFLLDNKAVVLSVVLRMGINGNKVDNASSGGIVCGVKENGQLKEVAYSITGKRYDQHPQGFAFCDCVVPSYKKALSMVTSLAERVPDLRLIAWDVAINESGEPVLIEANVRRGDVGVMQYANGPLFAEYTDRVLSEIFCQ
ncbi:MAG: sugar-transfer associated ATP-grasp domain-containing protein [Bacillota bacterium]|nr:sugar-transfer associated ATP-grasp domain-containing protein [Bacillota bacterium]